MQIYKHNHHSWFSTRRSTATRIRICLLKIKKQQYYEDNIDHIKQQKKHYVTITLANTNKRKARETQTETLRGSQREDEAKMSKTMKE